MMDYGKTKNYRTKKKLLIANVVAFVSLECWTKLKLIEFISRVLQKLVKIF